MSQGRRLYNQALRHRARELACEAAHPVAPLPAHSQTFPRLLRPPAPPGSLFTPPPGGVSKTDLRAILQWGADALGYPALAEVEAAPPTAELEPLGGDGRAEQSDEVDMGMTYEELGLFGRLRKVHRCGPVSMLRALLARWRGSGLAPAEVAAKVKHFFKCVQRWGGVAPPLNA